ncbi:GNAT family N-acetyltransferase [Streptomyces sp. NBC_00102]|uniref:GNAT family N-acetyltransferase n=1 Tax=Streptomyces sp. NBC_00102 TaxID=2975652 RepID=UPI00225096CA|nr:GNAT family protein [Streptomyces sp. NBC_00102]MCX5400927.1 GNAT family N-acetyltransferase [Streptomyces sp. NBC_00102]
MRVSDDHSADAPRTPHTPSAPASVAPEAPAYTPSASRPGADLPQGPLTSLRRFSPGDAAEFTARARESRALHRPWLFPPTEEAAYAAYAGRLLESPDKEGFLVGERTAGGAIAGFVNINNIVGGAFRCGALGYGAFAHAAGRGLMSEALGLVLRYAFGPLGLHRLEANVQPGNAASIALVRRAGFRLEGLSPDFLHIDGAWRDHERWAITSEMLPDQG